MGGTGKSPHIEYLIRLLKDNHKISTLSRGYGRKTKGFLIADKFSNATDIGDEPMQFKQKFNNINVAVDAKRVNGIKNLLKFYSDTDVILLDDAYQHRQVNPGFKILLTPYNDLYVDDFMLPTGRLREFASIGSKRADVIVVTKCNDVISVEERNSIKQKLNIQLNQSLFFSKIIYSDKVIGANTTLSLKELTKYSILLVTGIANPTPLINRLKGYDLSFKHLKFNDHHDFTNNDVNKIESEYANLHFDKKIVLTTEKDFVRLKATTVDNSVIMYLPIAIEIIGDDKLIFDEKIRSYVEKN